MVIKTVKFNTSLSVCSFKMSLKQLPSKVVPVIRFFCWFFWPNPSETHDTVVEKHSVHNLTHTVCLHLLY